MRFSPLATLLICAALWSSQAAAEENMSDFLAGRWGHANSDWKELSADQSKSSCALSSSGTDSSYRFSGDLSHLTVTSNINLESPGAVTSPATVGKKLAPEATTGSMHGAAAIMELSFKYRGMFGTEPSFNGHLGIMSHDRIILYMPGSYGPWFLVRCKVN